MTNYFWLAIGWSVAGFTIGFISCWLWVRSVVAAAQMELRARKGDGSRMSATKTVAGRTVIGVLILTLLILSSVRYYQRQDCQTRYNEAVAVALSETSAARGKETIAETNKAEAQAAWLRSLIVLNGQDPAKGLEITNSYLRALDEHVQALKALERARADHPMPVPANCR